jgi:hypothetical protein
MSAITTTTNDVSPSKTEWTFKPSIRTYPDGSQKKFGFLEAPNQMFHLDFTSISGKMKHHFKQFDQGNPEYIGRYTLKIIRTSCEMDEMGGMAEFVDGTLIDFNFFFNIESKSPDLISFGPYDFKGNVPHTRTILPSAGFHKAFLQAKEFYEEGTMEGTITTKDGF